MDKDNFHYAGFWGRINRGFIRFFFWLSVAWLALALIGGEIKAPALTAAALAGLVAVYGLYAYLRRGTMHIAYIDSAGAPAGRARRLARGLCEFIPLGFAIFLSRYTGPDEIFDSTAPKQCRFGFWGANFPFLLRSGFCYGPRGSCRPCLPAREDPYPTI